MAGIADSARGTVPGVPILSEIPAPPLHAQQPATAYHAHNHVQHQQRHIHQQLQQQQHHQQQLYQQRHQQLYHPAPGTLPQGQQGGYGQQQQQQQQQHYQAQQQPHLFPQGSPHHAPQQTQRHQQDRNYATAIAAPQQQHHDREQQQQQPQALQNLSAPSRHVQQQLQQLQEQQPHYHANRQQRALESPSAPGVATTHVGKYTLYGTIGEGAFGKVKRGINRETKEHVAVKIMDKKEIQEQDLSAQVRREIYIMRTLRHKHIVRMYEVLTSDTKLYIVMELVTGGELFERLEKHGRVDEALARHFFHQLVDGVDFCHKNGVAHRDLKPENLLLDANGDIKITDFGFSSMRGNDVNSGLLYTQCGTPDYCAPEIIEGADEGYNGAKVDVWSCGIILYALLVGALPFQEQETEKLYDLILACDVQYPPVISPRAKDLLSRLLVRNPAQRLTLAEIKRHEWFLVDYTGDDARLLKKPAFYNKGGAGDSNPGSRSSTPSASGRSTPKRDGHLPGQFQDVEQQSTNHSMVNPQARDRSQPEFRDRAQEPPLSTAPRSPRANDLSNGSSESSAGHADRDPMQVEQQRVPPSIAVCGHNVGASFGRAAHDAHGSKSSSPVGDDRTSEPESEQVGPSQRPQEFCVPRDSEGASEDAHAEAHNAQGRVAAMVQAHEKQLSPADESKPPSQAIFTRVEDRPATPASRVLAPPKASPGMSQKMPPMDVEDYADKPVPLLSLPTADARFQRHQTAQEIRHDSIPQPSVQRHRSDAGSQGLAAMHGPRQSSLPLSSNPGSHAAQISSPSTHAVRSASPAAAVIGGISARAGSPFRRGPGPGPHPAPHHDMRGSLLANRPMRLPSDTPRPSTSPVSSSSSAAGPHGVTAPGSPFGTGQAVGPKAPGNSLIGVPWHDNRGAGRSSSEELSGSMRLSSSDMIWYGPHAEQLSRRMWNMFDRWRVMAEEPLSPHASQELRMEFRRIQSEIAGIEGIEEKLSVYQQFMTLFGIKGLNTTEGRTDDLEGAEFEHRGGMMVGRTPTDLSSEDDGGSWSPVHDGHQPRSDFGRRREISDLLTKWIGKISTQPGHPYSREDSPDDAIGSEDGGNSMDLAELQRLMRQYHGGRDDSNLAEEIDRLMKNPELLDSGGYSLSGGGSEAPLSLSKLQPARSRSGDSQLQHTRWASHPVSVSSGPPSVSSGGRVLRSVIPADYVPGSFSDAVANGRADHNGNAGAFGDDIRGVDVGGRTREGVLHTPPSSGGSAGHAATKRPGRKQPDMASSMGLDNVEYYGPDRRGVSSKVKGVLLHIKGKNRRLVESSTWFTSAYDPDAIVTLLSNILTDMGAHVALKRETKRKIKVRLVLSDDVVLVAGIELMVLEDGLTKVSFKRSRADRGRTDTLAFTEFYEHVREQFTLEVQARGSRRRRSGLHAHSRTGDGKAPNSMQFELQPHSLDSHRFGEPTSLSQPQLAARGNAGSSVTNTPSRTSPRAASDMR